MNLYPYASDRVAAFTAAETSTVVVLCAALIARPLRSRVATALLMAAMVVVLAAPVPELAQMLGIRAQPDRYLLLLRFAAGIATLAMALSPPRWIALPAFAGQWALSWIADWARDANEELAALHLLWIGVLVGVHRMADTLRDDAPAPPAQPPSLAWRRFWREDLAAFALATLLAIVCCVMVELRSSSTGDEWANTFQAELFAHGRAYGPVPPCPETTKAYWVFYYMGRAFAQYTPGWPLVMAPFQRLGVVWLANPVVMGAASVAVARLARRAAASGIAGAWRVPERTVVSCGRVAVLLFVLAPSMLLDGASRFPHPLVCACLAWSVEAIAVLLDPDVDARGKWIAGLAVGSATSLLLATRPADGAALGPPLFVAYGYGLARRRFGGRALAATVATFAAVSALTLVILRLQLGKWLESGYQITGLYHDWAALTPAPARPEEAKHVFPLATGAYMWWPCAPALGALGLLSARGRARAIAFMLGAGAVCMFGLYWTMPFAHFPATGYGPRLHLPIVVAMAVGGGLVVGPLVSAARARAGTRSALSLAGPGVLAMLAVVVGVARIGLLVYPFVWDDVHQKTALFRALERDAEKLHHSVVTIAPGATAFHPMDSVQNDPLDEDPDVLLLEDMGDGGIACARERYADRRWFKAVGMDEVRFVPW